MEGQVMGRQDASPDFGLVVKILLPSGANLLEAALYEELRTAKLPLLP